MRLKLNHNKSKEAKITKEANQPDKRMQSENGGSPRSSVALSTKDARDLWSWSFRLWFILIMEIGSSSLRSIMDSIQNTNVDGQTSTNQILKALWPNQRKIIFRDFLRRKSGRQDFPQKIKRALKEVQIEREGHLTSMRYGQAQNSGPWGEAVVQQQYFQCLFLH